MYQNRLVFQDYEGIFVKFDQVVVEILSCLAIGFIINQLIFLRCDAQQVVRVALVLLLHNRNSVILGHLELELDILAFDHGLGEGITHDLVIEQTGVVHC